MEWVETTARTVEEAKEAALDELGVDESDAEFQVVEEPRSGLFGRLRSEARVRARVRPTVPRPKEDRRGRRQRRGDAGAGASGRGPAGTPAAAVTEESSPSASTGSEPDASSDAGAASGDGARSGGASGPRKRRRRRRSGSGGGADAVSTRDTPAAPRSQPTGPEARGPGNGNRESRRAVTARERGGAEVEVALDEQGQIAREFLSNLVAELGLDAQVAVVRPDDESVGVNLTGPNLGILIGSKGSTLLAIQDLARTVVHHRTGATNGRVHVDVGGYRQQRAEALSKFARDQAERVRTTGARIALEPMTPADRKVVHDAVQAVEGVSTASEGEEPNRRVVIVPTGS